MDKLCDSKQLPVKYYTFTREMEVAGCKCLVSRTGYTGEDGVELYCASEDAVKLWNALLEAGKENGLIPCGLGARDTLRLEAGMPLYGHEMNDEITPKQTGLGMLSRWTKQISSAKGNGRDGYPIHQTLRSEDYRQRHCP